MIWGVGKAKHTPRCRQTKERKRLENKTKLKQTSNNGTMWRQAFLYCAKMG
jgi:hypothetical protein